ncbi:LysR family transcriptional regulator [Variovorax paradoxus]|jgi:DNA-binding transcriptional LysR family regulator|uniref:LysR substrate-binding domain-containing protein n=1 Tax=Variovorax TaxID=34072 RepID=UPI0006E4B252|nr:LysR substrate-binding domain-containing protein [Variovorax sp.]KPU93610.1 LysR family transcriptional regulator [Variovorax paradoxus]KPU97259.1 LysR family transcriptional regulator [Variovorax paradoxus]KPV04864.1 LysR family transcriptional regulator [Variovorax paradoxus]KPV14459.1 LysR family transcriptional regulator [Variovorax paradoxus]KPV29481.1 LysR family transcriptional regulator [Variovorax paradoxus]
MRFAEIETFRALMRSSSTRKAAALLHVTQPAISQSLKRLETQAGMQLFQRTGGRLVPTPEARALWVEVERVFIGMDAIEHRVRSLRDFGTNQLELSCYPAFGLGFMPRALERFKAHRGASAWPQVSLQVLSSKDVRDRVSMGISDFGLMADELSLEGLEHSTFAHFPGVVVMPQGHALARFRSIEPEQLVEAPFLALNPEDPSHRRLEAALAQKSLALRMVVQTPYAASVCEMALRGLGVGLVNPITALDYAERGLVARKLSVDIFFACILALPAGKVLSSTARDFLSVMRQQLADDEKRMQRYLR